VSVKPTYPCPVKERWSMDFWTFVKKIRKTIPTFVKSAEDLLKDGKIEPHERKPLVMKWIRVIANEFEIHLNPIIYWILSILVNWAAQKLPSKDFVIPPFIKDFK